MDSAAKRRLGDIVLERNMVTPHQLAPRLTAAAASADPSVVEVALRERLAALTVELAARDQRIAQHDATINPCFRA